MSLSGIFRLIPCKALKFNINCIAAFSSKAPSQKIVKEIDPITGEVKTRKVDSLPRITLLSGDELQITTLSEAEKLSRRRDLKLVKLVDLDTKTQRPVYRLMTAAEYHVEDLKQKEKKKQERQFIKGEKVLLINSKIAQHDLETQLRKATKWITKFYEVRVIISGAGGHIQSSEKVYDSVEDYFMKSEIKARVVQKRQKGADIKFLILPVVPVQREVNEQRDDS